jgi:hypothetical protein
MPQEIQSPGQFPSYGYQPGGGYRSLVDELRSAQRTQEGLMEDLSQRGNMAQMLSMGPEALNAQLAMELANIRGANQQARRVFSTPEGTNWEQYQELLGAAQHYGIEDAQNLPLNVLAAMVEARRSGAQARVAADRIRMFEQDPGSLRSAAEGTIGMLAQTLGQGAAGLGIAAADEVFDAIQSLPGVGNWLRKTEFGQDWDRRMAQAQEAVIASMTEDEMAGYQAAVVAGTIGGWYLPFKFIGLPIAGKLTGLPAGTVAAGRTLSAISRTALRGMIAETILEAQRPRPIEQKLAGIAAGGLADFAFTFNRGVTGMALGAGTGGALGVAFGADNPQEIAMSMAAGAALPVAVSGLPVLLRRARQSFPTSSDPSASVSQPVQHFIGADDFRFETPSTEGVAAGFAQRFAGHAPAADAGGPPPPPPPGGGAGAGPGLAAGPSAGAADDVIGEVLQAADSPVTSGRVRPFASAMTESSEEFAARASLGSTHTIGLEGRRRATSQLGPNQYAAVRGASTGELSEGDAIRHEESPYTRFIALRGVLDTSTLDLIRRENENFFSAEGFDSVNPSSPEGIFHAGDYILAPAEIADDVARRLQALNPNLKVGAGRTREIADSTIDTLLNDGLVPWTGSRPMRILAPDGIDRLHSWDFKRTAITRSGALGEIEGRGHFDPSTGELYVSNLSDTEALPGDEVFYNAYGISQIRPMLAEIVSEIERVSGARVTRTKNSRFGAREGPAASGMGDISMTLTRDQIMRRAVRMQQAALDAVNYAKQISVTESSYVLEVAGKPRFDDIDVLHAQLEANGAAAANVVRNADVTNDMIARWNEERVAAGHSPLNATFVKNPDGTTDLVISRIPLTPDQVKQYEKAGIMSGSIVQWGSREMRVVELGAGRNEGQVKLSPTRMQDSSRTPPEYWVNQSDVLPRGRTDDFIPSDADRLWTEFRAYTTERVTGDLEASGFDLARMSADDFDEVVGAEMATHMDAFFRLQNVDDPLLRSAYEAHFNARRLDELRRYSPEALADLERVNTTLARMQRQLGPGDPVTIEELADGQGFIFERDRLGGGVLRQRDGQLVQTVDSESAARAFLRDFPTRAYDYTPVTGTPAELAFSPGSAGGGEMPATAKRDPSVRDGATDDAITSTERDIAHVEETISRIVAERLTGVVDAGPGPVRPVGGPPAGPPPPAPRQPATGGAGGSPPPSRPAAGTSFVGQSLEAANAIPGRIGQIQRRMMYRTNQLRRLVFPWRHLTMAIEQDLHELGIESGRLWMQTNEVSIAEDAAHAAMGSWLQRAGQVSAKFRRFNKRSGRAMEFWITKPEARAKVAQEYQLKPREVAAVDELETWMRDVQTEAAKEGVTIGYMPDYLHEVRNRSVRGEENPYFWDDMPEGFKFFADYARHHRLDARRMNLDDFLVGVTRAWKLKVHLDLPLSLVKNEWDNPLVAKYIPTVHAEVKGWLHQIRFGYNSDDDILVGAVAGALRGLGLPVSHHDVMQFFGGALTSMYRAGLGHRISAITRDAVQPFYTATKIGNTPVLDAYRTYIFGGVKERRKMIERGVRGGWVVLGQPQVPNAEMFTRSPLLPSGDEFFTERQLAARERVARVMDVFHDMLPEKYRLGIQGTKADPLILYTKLGELNRLISGEAGYRQAARALKKFRQGRMSQEDFVYQSRIDHYEAPVQRHAQRLLDAGRDEDFLNLMANEAANLQFRYGTREAPPAMRSFAGKFAMQFGTFSNQFAAYTGSSLAARGVSGKAKRDFLLRNAAVAGLFWYIGEEKDWDLMKWYWPTSLAFGGGPLGTMVALAGVGAMGTVRELSGQRATVEQEAARNAFQRSWDLRGGPMQFFPYAGTLKTANDINEIMMQDPGTRVDPTMNWMFMGRPYPSRANAAWVGGIVEPMFEPNPAGGAGDVQSLDSILAQSQAGAQGLTPPMDPNVVVGPSGMPVVSSRNPAMVGPDGKRPSHFVDRIREMLQPGETVEDLEQRVLSRSDFGPDTAAIRSEAALHPEVRIGLVALLEEARAMGIHIQIAETDRTQNRQEWLFQQGRSRSDPRGPATYTLTSNHFGGRAADLVTNTPGGYEWIQANAPRFGFDVLGMWDAGHVQMPAGQRYVPGVAPDTTGAIGYGGAM